MTTTISEAAENTDRELWREHEGDFYADSLFVTRGGGIGMDVGGYVIVRPIKDWFAAMQTANLAALTQTSTISEAQVDAHARMIARPIRGCATDEQYQDVVDRASGAIRAALTAAAQAAPERTVDTTKLNAGQLVQRIMRVMDHNDAGSGGIAKLAEAIAAGILDLPANYWTSAAQAGEKVSPEMIATLKRLDAEPPEATFTSCEDLMTYLDDGPSPAPAPLDKIDHRSIIIHRVARLICFETCRAGLCKDSERCCGGSQSPIRISEERAKGLLAPLLERAADGWQEVLNRYRYAVHYAAADSWDGGIDIRRRFEWARTNDPHGQLSSNEAAWISRDFHTNQSAAAPSPPVQSGEDLEIHETDWSDIGSVCRTFGNERAAVDQQFANRVPPGRNWWKEAADRIATITQAIEHEKAQTKIMLDSYAVENQQLSDRAIKAEQALAEAREVIAPFAKMADQVDTWQSGTDPRFDGSFDAGDLRRARAWWERNRTAAT